MFHKKTASPILTARAFHGFTLIEVMIVVTIMSIVVAIAAPTWWRARERSQQKTCQENLQKIDGAKEQWALENQKPGSTSVALDNLIGSDGGAYLKYRVECPSNGVYVLGTITEQTNCSITTPFDHNEDPGAALK